MGEGSTGTVAGAEQRKKRIAVVGGTALGGLLDQGTSVEEAVREVMDLDSPPKPHLLKALACFTSDPDDRALLLLLGSAANGGKVGCWAQEGGRGEGGRQWWWSR